MKAEIFTPNLPRFRGLLKRQYFWLRYFSLRYLGRRRGFIWRGLLGWLIGVLMFYADDLNSLDTRLQIRGNQQKSKEISLVTISNNEIPSPFNSKSLKFFQETSNQSDSFYWNKGLWLQMLQGILAQKPKMVAVTLFFSESSIRNHLSPDEMKLFQDQRIVWTALNAANDKPLLPAFANADASNVASSEILRDQDGLIRRFPDSSASAELPTIPEVLARVHLSSGEMPFINYRGDSRVFSEYAPTDIINASLPADAFTDKIVIIGPESRASSQYLTPLGPSTRQASLAAMTDQLLTKRTILRTPHLLHVLQLFLLMLIALGIMTRVPQSLAIILLIWLATLWAALSVWVFDSFYFWIPVVSVWGTIGACYVMLLGYQANEIEKKHYRLQQEQEYLLELEQLKNNFVSLISHDLKTPIAKIQAILDRIMLRPASEELQRDLETLSQSNKELNRYIHSILQMLRVESRDFHLHIDIGEINEVIEDAWAQLAPLADAKRLKIKMELEPMFSIEFDRTLIREVLVNIFDNAIKYSPDLSEITIHSWERDNLVQVEVRDTGPGIPQEELPSIWGKFVRGKDQESHTKGSGLGLYLVKFFIELHGGHVFIESKPPTGTRIGFALPVSSNNQAEEGIA